MSVIFYALGSKKLIKFGVLYSLIVSFASFYISFDISITDNLYYFAYNYLKIHLYALSIYFCFKNKLNFKSAMSSVFFVSLLISVLELVKYKYIDSVSFSQEMSQGIEQYIDVYISTVKTTGFNVNFEQLSEMLHSAKDILLMMYPSILIIFSFIEAFIVYYFSRLMIELFCHEKFDQDQKLRTFYIGKGLSFIVLLLLFISKSGSMFENCVFNFTLIASFLYFVNGFAVIKYLFGKLVKNNFLLCLCMLSIVLLSFITMLIMPTLNGISGMFIIGLTDTTFDFRRIHRKKLLIKK